MSYSIVYTPADELPFTNITLSEKEGHTVISISYKGQGFTDTLSDVDATRLRQEEITVADLAYKYFAYLL